jgi:hypothetical protein
MFSQFAYVGGVLFLNNRFVSNSCEEKMPQHCKNQLGREFCIFIVP